MDDLERAKALFLDGLDLHNHGRFEEAERSYREAARYAPERPSILVNMAAVLISQLKFQEGLEWSRRALAVEPHNTDARESERYCLKMLQQPSGAGNRLPSDPALAREQLSLHVSQGRIEEALAFADRLIALDAGDTGARASRADLLARLDRADEAIIEYRHLLLGTEPPPVGAGEDFCRNLFDDALWPVAEGVDFDRLLAAALCAPWHRPSELAPMVARRVALRDWAGPALAQVAGAWPRPTLLRTAVVTSAARDELLESLLHATVVTGEAMEQLLASLRFSLLVMACRCDAGTHAEEVPANLLQATAIQCHLNEYVTPVSAAETRLVAALVRRSRGSMRRDVSMQRTRLLAVAMYGCLHETGVDEAGIEALHSPGLAKVFDIQLANPRREQRLARNLTSWSDIQDPVSRAVREQYEANPYPRWQSTPVDVRPVHIASYVNQRLARVVARAEEMQGVPRVLVAGGGTGQQAIELAARITRAQVTSLDLSRASLAYAQRQADKLRVENVRFVHGDLLQLDRARGPYQLIECSGVLHHMDSIEAGLEALLGVLDPRGLLRIGLYSAIGRAAVKAARHLVAEHGLDGSLEGIREFRKLVHRLDAGHPVKAVAGFSDFYSTSECRDLAFHVHESTVDIPRIGAMLERFDLEFLGFEATQQVREAFVVRHPAPGAMLDLDNWTSFERDHPETFSGMYQFWARRRNP